MLKLKYYLFFCLLLTTFFASSQNRDKKLDSLRKTIKSSMFSVARADSFNKLSRDIRLSNPKQSLIFAYQSLLISQTLTYKLGVGKSTFLIGNIYEDKADYQRALNYYSIVLKHLKKNKNDEDLAKCFQSIGDVYNALGDLQKSLEYYLQSLDLFIKIKSQKGRASLLNQIGLINVRINQNEDALSNFKEANKIFNEIKDARSASISNYNLALVYIKTKQYELAINNLNNSLTTFDQFKDKFNTVKVLNGLGDIYFQKNQLNKALGNYLRALKIAKSISYKYGEGYSLRGIGDLYLKQNNFDRSLDYYTQSLNLYKKIGSKPELADNYERLATLKDKFKDIKQANAYYRLAKTYKDSIYNETVKAQVAEIQAKTDLEQKEDEINVLSKEHQSTQKALKQQKLIASQRQSQFIFVVIILILVIGISILFYYSRQKIRKINKALLDKNKKIESVNKKLQEQSIELRKAFVKIADSIKYAEAVQQAFLPSEEKINEILGDHFIIYKAKDAVSGDFFWLSEINEGGVKERVVSCIDCTGHGFAGGLMTMITNTLLNEIINQEHILSPAEILRLMHIKMMDVLITNPTENVSIGMDMCICFFSEIEEEESTKIKLKFAGAKSSIYIINENGFTELRGDRKSIGFQTEDDRVFTDREIILDKGSHIYLSTDGYMDQANDKGRRFGSPKLKKLLNEIVDKPMNEQLTILEKSLEEHQGNASQRDDITLIGMKI